jgi:hypothetical protein
MIFFSLLGCECSDTIALCLKMGFVLDWPFLARRGYLFCHIAWRNAASRERQLLANC